MVRYLDALEAELETLIQPRPVQTLFIGGGTPSHLPEAQLERLLRVLKRWFPLESDAEYSIEANPESLTADKIVLLAQHGVNRVSLGAQSFDPRSLAVLQRSHDPTTIATAVKCLSGSISQISIDLIFGVPGQTVAHWTDDLDRALNLGISHISTYGLTYEKGTSLWKQRRSGRLIPLTEDDELTLYQTAIERLTKASFTHYEISNFALEGRQSRHNQIYWANYAYYGIGLGAARYVGGVREVNTRDFDAYLAGRRSWQSEKLSPLDRARETMAVQLRRAEGIHRVFYRRQTGHDLDAVAPRLAALVDQGVLIDTSERVFLSANGKYVADAVIEKLL